MLHISNFKLDDRELRFEELRFLIIQFNNELSPDLVRDYDGIVLNGNSRDQNLKIISWFRKNPLRSFYLKPLFIASGSEDEAQLKLASDGTTDMIYLQNMAQTCRDIKLKINQLPDSRIKGDFTEIVSHKLLEHLFSRQSDLKPYSTRNSSFAYFFPFINSIVEGEDAHKAIDLLSQAQRSGYLTAELQDKIHVCKTCSGNYLNFRESCPKCNTIDIRPEDVIHHFVCAHVAPASDFEKDGNLHCPKCDKDLRHIGIDYDKPSTIQNCNNCLHQFQNPNMTAYCIDCHEENDLAQLNERSINRYSLSSKGETYILNYQGEPVEKAAPAQVQGLLSLEFFRIMLQQEISRSQIRNTGAYFGQIKIKEQVFNALNEESKVAIKLEISRIIRNYLPPSDILSAKNHSSYYFILTETTQNQADKKTALIVDNLDMLLGNNLDSGTQVVEINYEAVQPSTSLDL